MAAKTRRPKGAPASAPAQNEAPVLTRPTRKPVMLTPAQQAHLKPLIAETEQAQQKLNEFANYLLAEYGINRDEGWLLTAEGFLPRDQPPADA